MKLYFAKLVGFCRRKNGEFRYKIGEKRGFRENWRNWRNWWDSAPPDLAGGGPLINIFFGGILQNALFFFGPEIGGILHSFFRFSHEFPKWPLFEKQVPKSSATWFHRSRKIMNSVAGEPLTLIFLQSKKTPIFPRFRRTFLGTPIFVQTFFWKKPRKKPSKSSVIV